MAERGSRTARQKGGCQSRARQQERADRVNAAVKREQPAFVNAPADDAAPQPEVEELRARGDAVLRRCAGADFSFDVVPPRSGGATVRCVHEARCAESTGESMRLRATNPPRVARG